LLSLSLSTISTTSKDILRRLSHTETCREDILVLLALAERIAQAELPVAVIARFLGGADGEVWGRFLCVHRGIEGHDGAVSEASALAKGRGSCTMSVCAVLDYELERLTSG
jgi:hypothetical protein